MGTTFRDFHHGVGRISRRFGDVFTTSAPKSLFKLDTYIFTPLTLDLYATGIQAAIFLILETHYMLRGAAQSCVFLHRRGFFGVLCVQRTYTYFWSYACLTTHMHEQGPSRGRYPRFTQHAHCVVERICNVLQVQLLWLEQAFIHALRHFWAIFVIHEPVASL
jgi:hypothetical protein